MTAADQPDDPAPVDPVQRRDNGLRAATYVPLTDVEPAFGAHLLTALRRARIAAFLDPAAGADGQYRLHVATDERGDARTIVAALLRGVATQGDGGGSDPAADHAADGGAPDYAIDGGGSDDAGSDDATEAAFRALVADWKVDTIAAVRQAERDLSREDEDWRLRLGRSQASDEVWLDDDHYVPPAPPPLPRLAAPTVIAMAVLVMSLVVLGFSGLLGLADGARLVVGIGGLLLTAGILLSRVREHRADEDDDGSAI